MSAEVKLVMKPVNSIITRLGTGVAGDVQRFVTNEVNRRITRYMPYRTGTLATKLKHIKSPTEIEVLGPYAAYQYYGKVMVGSPPKVATDKDLVYSTHKNPLAGPFWDRRMLAAEGKQLAADVQKYVDRKAGKA